MPASKTTIPILMYHSVASEKRGELARWTLAPALFGEHVRYLCEQGYTTYSISDLASALDGQGTLAPKPLAITFDDAFRDFTENALPILATHHAVATLYVPTAFIGGEATWISREPADARPILTAAELREVVAAGVECGAHTHTHPELDLLPVDDLRREVRRSKEELEATLGCHVASFAYPFGYYDGMVRNAVIEAGYTSACAVGEIVGSPASDRYALPRLTIEADATVETLKRLLMRPSSPAAWRRSRAKQAAWRTARRALKVARVRRDGAR